MGNTIKPLTTNWNLEKNNENQEKRLKPSINQLKPEKKCFFFSLSVGCTGQHSNLGPAHCRVGILTTRPYNVPPLWNVGNSKQ